MKRCPTCDRTFEDTMRFCQSDGTPLVDDAPPLDPYKTMVARPEDVAGSGASVPQPANDQVLEIPKDSDPNKTMFASEDEIRREMNARDEQVIEIPPLSGGGAPPSPFDAPREEPSPFGKSTPPIPSPFDSPKPSTYRPDESTPAFADPEPLREEPSINPFDMPNAGRQEMAQTEWTPPPAPDANWQNQQIGQNTPFQPPPAGSGSVNQTLPIISLVLGIVSLCCYISPVTGIAALVTGYLALKNIKNDPANYGGKGLAIAGMITGGIFLAIGLFYWIYIIFIVGLAALGSIGNV